MKKLILIGGGGHCISCVDVIESTNEFSIEGILDHSLNAGDRVLGYEVLGNDKDIPKFISLGASFLITIGELGKSDIRKRIFNQLKAQGADLATVISSRAYVSKHAKLGAGSIVMHGATINAGVIIGENCIVNSHALIEHDCRVGNGAHVSTGAIINGGVVAGDNVFFGSSSTTIQSSNVPSNSFIKASSMFNSSGTKKLKVAFLTTAFEQPESFTKQYFDSLNRQTCKEFDLIILNDGCKNLNDFIEEFNFSRVIRLKPKGSIAKNREYLIKYAIGQNYDIVIFGDFDDFFAPNRVEESLSALSRCDIVVNDLVTVNESGKASSKLISNRVNGDQKITLDFILDKNVFGLSNTAIQLKKVPISSVEFSSELVAVDWFFFSTLLVLGLEATFINTTFTYYRQYESNVVGSQHITLDNLDKVISVKLKHYESMLKISDIYRGSYDEMDRLKQELTQQRKRVSFVEDCQNNISFPLWWEIFNRQNI